MEGATFTWSQWLGFIAFLGILSMGFWLMIFLLSYVIPYWVIGSSYERIKEILATRKLKKKSDN